MGHIVGLSGLAGCGKDTVANYLVFDRDFTKVSLADPMKRFCQEVFNWSRDRLWGESDKRSAPDVLRTRPDGTPLTARFALQTLGTEWGRNCYENVWIDYALRHAHTILPVGDVVIPDVRFRNELDAIHAAGGEVWRIVRPGAGLDGDAAKHASENELTDADCDRVILNDGTFKDLRNTLWGIRLGEKYP